MKFGWLDIKIGQKLAKGRLVSSTVVHAYIYVCVYDLAYLISVIDGGLDLTPPTPSANQSNDVLVSMCNTAVVMVTLLW